MDMKSLPSKAWSCGTLDAGKATLEAQNIKLEDSQEAEDIQALELQLKEYTLCA